MNNSKAKIIAVANQKGGVAKTTSVTCTQKQKDTAR